MISGIKCGFKVHEIQGVGVPHDFQRGVKLIVRVPELEHDRHKVKERQQVGDVSGLLLFDAVEGLAGTPQRVGPVGKDAGAIGVEPWPGGGDVGNTGQIGDRSVLAAETAVGLGTAEDVENGHALVEPGRGVSVPQTALYLPGLPAHAELLPQKRDKQVFGGMPQVKFFNHPRLVVADEFLLHFGAGYVIIRNSSHFLNSFFFQRWAGQPNTGKKALAIQCGFV